MITLSDCELIVELKPQNQEVKIDVIEAHMFLEGFVGEKAKEPDPVDKAPKWVTAFKEWFFNHYHTHLSTAQASGLAVHVHQEFEKYKKKFDQDLELGNSSTATPSDSLNEKSTSSVVNSPSLEPSANSNIDE